MIAFRRENKTLVRAAENSVATGYKARANQFSRGGDTDIDGRISAAGSFKSADTAVAAGAAVLGRGPRQYGLASDLPGGPVDKLLNVQQWEIPKVGEQPPQ